MCIAAAMHLCVVLIYFNKIAITEFVDHFVSENRAMLVILALGTEVVAMLLLLTILAIERETARTQRRFAWLFLIVITTQLALLPHAQWGSWR